MSSSRATVASQIARSIVAAAAAAWGSSFATNPGWVSTTTRTLSARSISGMAPS
jgi:hypothetical protein